MTRRPLLLSYLAIILTILGVAVWLLLPRPTSEINQKNAEKIQVGMTLAEVEAILGGPARDESTGPLTVEDDLVFNLRLVKDLRKNSRSDWTFWTTNQIIIVVDFDGEHRVANKISIPVRRRPESPLNMVRRWLRL